MSEQPATTTGIEAAERLTLDVDAPVPPKEELLDQFARKQAAYDKRRDNLRTMMVDRSAEEKANFKRILDEDQRKFDALKAKIGYDEYEKVERDIASDELAGSPEGQPHLQNQLNSIGDRVYEKFVALHSAEQGLGETTGATYAGSQGDESATRAGRSIPVTSGEQPPAVASEPEVVSTPPLASEQSAGPTEAGRPRVGLTPEMRAQLEAISRAAGSGLTAEQRRALEILAHPVSEEEARAASHDAEDAAFREQLADQMVGRALRDKMADYAQAMADMETKIGFGIGRWRTGTKKREEALARAEASLFGAQQAYAGKLVDMRRLANRYEGTPEERNQAMSDDFLCEFRTMDKASRQATLENRRGRIDNRNVFQKGLAAVGKFLNGGRKNGWFRNAGTGAGAGGLVATGAILSGVGWPITAAAGIGLREGVRGVTRINALDTSLEDYRGEMLSDADFDSLRRSGNPIDGSRAIANEIFSRSRAEGSRVLSEARAKAKDGVKKFTIGYAAGGGAIHAAHFIHGLFEQPATSSSGSVQPPGRPEQQPAGPGKPNLPPAHVPAPGEGFEFAQGASHISPGEGWYHQLADMGFSRQQVYTLFQDDQLMQELVRQGVAYNTTRPGIGGVGILMPTGGELPQLSMDTIKQAAIAKGFIK